MSRIITFMLKVRWFIFIVFFSTLCYGLFKSGAPPNPFESFDKVLHCIAFFGFSLVTRFAFIRATGIKVWLVLLISAPISEYLQHYLQPHRTFSWLDVMANLTGIMLALFIWLAAQEIQQNNTSHA